MNFSNLHTQAHIRGDSRENPVTEIGPYLSSAPHLHINTSRVGCMTDLVSLRVCVCVCVCVCLDHERANAQPLNKTVVPLCEQRSDGCDR